MLPLARLIDWHKVAIAAVACGPGLVGLTALALLIVPVGVMSSPLTLIPPVHYERAMPPLPQPVQQAAPLAPVVEPLAPVVEAEAIPPMPIAAEPVVAVVAVEKCDICAKGESATYGTAIHFNGNPLQAADLAGKSKQLLFVLHVSGNFEDDRFT